MVLNTPLFLYNDKLEIIYTNTDFNKNLEKLSNINACHCISVQLLSSALGDSRQGIRYNTASKSMKVHAALLVYQKQEIPPKENRHSEKR